MLFVLAILPVLLGLRLLVATLRVPYSFEISCRVIPAFCE
jgi:hypothetical protein